jgi:hypothetical protein
MYTIFDKCELVEDPFGSGSFEVSFGILKSIACDLLRGCVFSIQEGSDPVRTIEYEPNPDGNGRLNANAHPNSEYGITVWIPNHKEVVFTGKTKEHNNNRFIQEIEAMGGQLTLRAPKPSPNSKNSSSDGVVRVSYTLEVLHITKAGICVVEGVETKNYSSGRVKKTVKQYSILESTFAKSGNANGKAVLRVMEDGSETNIFTITIEENNIGISCMLMGQELVGTKRFVNIHEKRIYASKFTDIGFLF